MSHESDVVDRDPGPPEKQMSNSHARRSVLILACGLVTILGCGGTEEAPAGPMVEEAENSAEIAAEERRAAHLAAEGGGQPDSEELAAEAARSSGVESDGLVPVITSDPSAESPEGESAGSEDEVVLAEEGEGDG